MFSHFLYVYKTKRYMLMRHLFWYVLLGYILTFYYYILLQHHPAPAAEMPAMSLLQHQNPDLANQVPFPIQHTIHTNMHPLSPQVNFLSFFSPPYKLLSISPKHCSSFLSLCHFLSLSSSAHFTIHSTLTNFK